MQRKYKAKIELNNNSIANYFTAINTYLKQSKE